jgi:hypothetical protein
MRKVQIGGGPNVIDDPKFVITIYSPRNLSSVKTELNHKTRNSFPSGSLEV